MMRLKPCRFLVGWPLAGARKRAAYREGMAHAALFWSHP